MASHFCRMLRHFVAAAAMASAAAITPGVRAMAQTPQRDTGAVLTAVIRHVRSAAPDGRTAIGFADSLHMSSAIGAEIATALAVDLIPLKTARVCSGDGPAYCHLVGIRVFINVTSIIIRNDSAEVFLTVLDETRSKRQPIHYEDLKATAVLHRGIWVNVRIEKLAET